MTSQIFADEGETAALGAKLASLLAPGDLVLLEGGLGAGKTTLARGLIGAFCGARHVPSPTYTLVEIYEGEIASLWHFDLFRLEKPEDVWELGLEDALDGGISLIEWPERAAGLLPAGAVGFHLEITGETERRLSVTASDLWRRRLKAAGIL